MAETDLRKVFGNFTIKTRSFSVHSGTVFLLKTLGYALFREATLLSLLYSAKGWILLFNLKTAKSKISANSLCLLNCIAFVFFRKNSQSSYLQFCIRRYFHPIIKISWSKLEKVKTDSLRFFSVGNYTRKLN